MKTKKRKKSSRMHGRAMGTHGYGARKKHKKSGHKGGKGMSGSGKRADHKKTLINKLHGGKYFGKQGITSKGTKRDKRNRINLQEIELNLKTYIKKSIAKKTKDGFEINLNNYKILGKGEIKNKLIIKANEFSKSAKNKVEAKEGEIILTRSPKISQTKEASKSAIEKVKKIGGEIQLGKKPNKPEKPTK
tara:strand:+ start:847 stop:1416 length:570 start_codon:yes stop_codon:yes gene_type:complete